MATYFSIKNGNFNNSLGTTVGDVSAAGVLGFILTTVYSYPTTTTATVTQPIYGVAFQLSSVKGTPEGTVDVILSATDGNFRTASFPVSGLTQNSGRNSISIATPVSWQVFAFNTPMTATTAVPRTMRVGIKTSVLDKVCLMGASLVNLNRSYICTTTGTPNSINDVIHIVGSLSGTSLITNTINYNIVGAKTYGNFYVHNGGTLNFDPTISFDVTLAGTQGMQITPDGTVNFGTSSVPVQADKTHQINLNNCYINVQNGGSLNTYGAYKTPYALLRQNTDILNPGVYPLATDISNWITNITDLAAADKVIVTPNSSVYNSFENTAAYAVLADNKLQLHGSVFAHISSVYIPSIVNMTRNVRFTGTNTTFGYIRFLDGSKSILNNTEFNGFRHATYKGIQFCTDSTGSVSLSNCVFNGDWVASMPAFSFDSTRTPTHNVSIVGCSFAKYGLATDIITLAQVSVNSFTFTDNIVLSSSENGMLVDRLSSTYVNIKNNFLIGSRKNGLLITNPYILSGSVGGVGCVNQVCGSVVTGTRNVVTYDGLAGHYNNKEGVNISATMPNLSSTVFYNLTASNNKTSGVRLSGNSNNLFTPIKVNIDGAVLNNNYDAGLEVYSMTGNLSRMNLANNSGSGIKTSIGNGVTVFDQITSTGSTKRIENTLLTKSNVTVYNDYTPFTTGTERDKSINFTGASTSYIRSTVPIPLIGDFTIELWAYFSALTTHRTLCESWSAGGGGWQIYWRSDTKAISFYANSSTVAEDTSTTTILINNWYHIAVTRTSGVVRLFVGGILRDTATFVADMVPTQPLNLGTQSSMANNGFNGFISNFRVVQGTAVYTEDFIPPQSPLSLIKGTAILYKSPYDTTFIYDNVTAEIAFLSGKSYSSVSIKNSKLQNSESEVNSCALYFGNTNFEEFTMDSSSLTGSYEDIGSSSSVDFLRGSYKFNTCTFGTGILSSTIQNYQPEVFNETGFVVMKEGGDPNKHYRILQSGKISLDDTLAYESNTISEKLEPASIITKLRCGSKLVPVNRGETYKIQCYIYKSVGYTGAAPRLILKRNSALGYSDTTLATSVSANGVWELLTNNVLPAQDHGIFEVYVDCSGSFGCGSVNIDNWGLTLL